MIRELLLIDLWNYKTFDAALCEMLQENSELIFNYYVEDQRLLDEHLNSNPYKSLGSNKHADGFMKLFERLIPLLHESRFRVWHYTRLLTHEVTSMEQALELSTLDSLKRRLDKLRQMELLTQQETEIILDQTVFHKQQDIRSNRIWTVTVPKPPECSGVELLLKNWGGEACYFWLSNQQVVQKLMTIGTPRIIEIEIALGDKLKAHCAAKTIVEAWANYLGVLIKITGCDMEISSCIKTAKVLHVHSAGDGTFEKIATTYPIGCSQILTI